MLALFFVGENDEGCKQFTFQSKQKSGIFKFLIIIYIGFCLVDCLYMFREAESLNGAGLTPTTIPFSTLNIPFSTLIIPFST